MSKLTRTTVVYWPFFAALIVACGAVDDGARETLEVANELPSEAQADPAELSENDGQFELLAAMGGVCAGKPGKKRGRSDEVVSVGFLESRSFIYYAPRDLDPNQPTPLVIVPHGFVMTGEDMYDMTRYRQLADKEKFVVVFPDGGGIFPWNVGRGVNGWGGGVNGDDHNDQIFVDAIIKFVEEDQCLDRAHVFMSGFSMGGYFSNEVGCVRNDFAAVGPHSGGSHDLTRCPGKIKPVIIFHGDADWLIYYEAGLETRDRWVKRNSCSSSFDKVPVRGGTCEYYKNCTPGGQVAFCHFDGLSHAWAGGDSLLFGDPFPENAAELGWKFFKQYAW